MHLRWQRAAFRNLESRPTKSGNMYDAPDNQVLCLPCILRSMQTIPHIILSRDASCALRNFLLIFYGWYVCTNRLIESVFNAPRTCCCWWLCLEVKKRQKTVRTRGFVRFINTVHRRETAVEKQRFRSCPEKGRENRTKPRFCTVYPYGVPWRIKRCCTVFPTESGAAP